MYNLIVSLYISCGLVLGIPYFCLLYLCPGHGGHLWPGAIFCWAHHRPDSLLLLPCTYASWFTDWWIVWLMMADVWERKSGIGKELLEEFGVKSWVGWSRWECNRRIGEIKRWVRRMNTLTEVFWESVPKSWCTQRRQRSGCWTSERMRLEDEIGKDKNDDELFCSGCVVKWF